MSKKLPALPREASFGWLVAVLGIDMASSLERRLKPIGLNLTVWPTLFALWEEDGITQTELAKRCRTANYTTTRGLDALEEKGLIKRHAHPTSRRTHLVYLTDAGRSLETQGTNEAYAANEEFLSALTDAEREDIKRLIKKIIASRDSANNHR
ncbi:MAG: MarR family transcriptional regulator [Natronospirillum sp.]